MSLPWKTAAQNKNIPCQQAVGGGSRINMINNKHITMKIMHKENFKTKLQEFLKSH